VSSDAILGEVLTRLSSNPSDEEAWRHLYSVVWPFAYAVLRRSRGVPDSVSRELAQDSLGQLAEYVLSPRGAESQRRRTELLARFGRDPRQFWRWFRRVVLNRSIDWYRREHRTISVDFETERAPATDLDSSILVGEYRQLLPEFFKNLMKRDRRQEFELLCIMATEYACSDYGSMYLWILAVLDRNSEDSSVVTLPSGDEIQLDRTAIIKEFGERLRLTPNYTYVRLLRLRNQFNEARSETFS